MCLLIGMQTLDISGDGETICMTGLKFALTSNTSLRNITVYFILIKFLLFESY